MSASVTTARHTAELLRLAAEAHPEREAYVHGEKRVTYEWLDRAADGFAAQLAAREGLDLDPAKPGYENIIVRPIPGGGFTWARAKYDSIRGRIETSWRTRGQRFELDVTVPGNTTATVYVPTQRDNSAMEGGQLASSADGVRYLGHEAGCDVFRVGGGTYQFQGTLPRP